MDLLDDEILRLWKNLHDNNVQYILVGGFATSLNGFSRTTADLDIWLKDSPENRKNLQQALKTCGIGDFPSIKTMEFVPGWTTIRLTSGLELDLMTSLKGFDQNRFDECLKEAPQAEIQNIPIRFLHINHLIEAKKASCRPKDKVDVIELERIRKESKNT